MIFVIDKPSGMTSHDVVWRMKRALGRKIKIGHTGTLDPMCTGVLPVLTGNDTKLSDLLGGDKEYVATMRLGLVTDTQDITGEVLEKHGTDGIGEDDVRRVLASFVGETEQLPPMYSSVKVGGKKLYELAREGKTVERKARKITVYEIEYLGTVAENEYKFRVACSKGTYIRTIIDDAGRALGCGACMSSLRRTKAGMFTLSQAITLPQILEFAKENDPQELLMPVDALFSQYPPLIVELGQAEKLRHGAQIKDWHFAPGTYRVYSITGEFLLLGKVENTILTTIKSFFEV